MTTQTAAEQIASFTTSAFKDGETSDGAPTAEETAASAANQTDAEKAAAAAATTDDDDDDELDDDAGEGDKPGESVEDKAAKDAAAAAAKPADDKAAKGGKQSAKERIGDLTAARRTAEREAQSEKSRADSLQAQLDAMKSGKAPLTAPQGDAKGGDVPPDPSTFDYGELDPKYIAALARHETGQALKADKAETEKTRQADAAAVTQREQAQKTDALVKAGVKLHDDFDDVVMEGAKTGKWQLSQTLGELILDSEFGPNIAYELASDPDEAERVHKLSPAKQAAYFGAQEAKFEAAKPSQTAKPSKTPQAPPPPKTPKGGSGSNKIGADSADFAAVEQAWKTGALR